MLVATTRARGSSTDPDAFTAARSKNLNYASLTISIPPHHKAGEIEWPDQVPPDPSRNFVTTDRQFISDNEFLKEIRRRADLGGPESNDVLVFVHGYNNLYQESVYRFAQIIHDSGFTGTAVLFAWPSMGKAPLYVADREASTYSRDYLERVLLQIAALHEVREISILAHSMGNWLAVETLRQAKMNGHGHFNGKLGEVILAAADLDENVFRTQLDVIGRLRRPMTVLVSSNDEILGLSELLAGGVERVGEESATDMRVVAAAERYNLRVVDITAVHDGDGNVHSKFARSGAIMAAIGRGLESEKNIKAQAGTATALTEVGNSLIKVPSAIFGANGP
jgi:esterase/lipase superfamily enzyme